jgi:hypothetical protein
MKLSDVKLEENLNKGKSAEFLGTGHQSQYGLIPLSVIFMRVWRHLLGLWGCTLGLYLKLYPYLSIPMAFYSIIYIISVIINIVIDGKIHHHMCVDTYSLNCIHFPL